MVRLSKNQSYDDGAEASVEVHGSEAQAAPVSEPPFDEPVNFDFPLAEAPATV